MVRERPYDERPAARPIASPPAAAVASPSPPAARATRSTPWGTVVTGVALALAVLGIIFVLNTNKGMAPEASTPACDAAFAASSTAMNQHYATHPLFGAEYDAIYADGEVSDEERVVLDAMLADEEAAFTALVDPVYDACTGLEDLYAGAFAHRDDADWALVDVESMSREDIKAGFIFSHCYENEARPACADFVLDDWNRQL